MIKQRGMKFIIYFIFLQLTINLSYITISHSSEFEIDEVVTAIKNEIQTVNNSELGSPNFIIETVDVALSVASKEMEKGALVLKIVGFSNEVDNGTSAVKSYHKLNYTFQPTETSGFSTEISLGLVESIKKAKSSFRKACNTPPILQMDGFTFKIEFTIVQNMDDRIHFKILGLEELKAQKIATHHVTLHIKITN